MNLAQSTLNYYESENFEDSYTDCLIENFSNNENEVIKNIISFFNTSNYETEKFLSNHKIITVEQAKSIYTFISNNIDSFIVRFNGYYVGACSLASISFGEQQESLEGILNYKTNKEYNLPYLKKLFASHNFYVSGDSAYYIVSGGLQINLLNDIEKLNSFLLTI